MGDDKLGTPAGRQGLMILEINSFANPVPFKRMPVSSLIEQFL